MFFAHKVVGRFTVDMLYKHKVSAVHSKNSQIGGKNDMGDPNSMSIEMLESLDDEIFAKVMSQEPPFNTRDPDAVDQLFNILNQDKKAVQAWSQPGQKKMLSSPISKKALKIKCPGDTSARKMVGDDSTVLEVHTSIDSHRRREVATPVPQQSRESLISEDITAQKRLSFIGRTSPTNYTKNQDEPGQVQAFETVT